MILLLKLCLKLFLTLLLVVRIECSCLRQCSKKGVCNSAGTCECFDGWYAFEYESFNCY